MAWNGWQNTWLNIQMNLDKLKDDFYLEVVFFDIFVNTIYCSWCKVVYSSQILLVEDIRTKEWSLPGGYAEIGSSPKENIVKEVFEETGLNVTVDKLLAVFDTDLREDIPQLFQYYKMIFSCTIVDGSFQDNLETSNIGFFSFNDMPKLSEKRTTKEQLVILENRTTTYCD